MSHTNNHDASYSPDEFDLVDLLRLMWSGKWILACCVLISLAVGLSVGAQRSEETHILNFPYSLNAYAQDAHVTCNNEVWDAYRYFDTCMKVATMRYLIATSDADMSGIDIARAQINLTVEQRKNPQTVIDVVKSHIQAFEASANTALMAEVTNFLAQLENDKNTSVGSTPEFAKIYTYAIASKSKLENEEFRAIAFDEPEITTIVQRSSGLIFVFPLIGLFLGVLALMILNATQIILARRES